ncbi:TolC family protein [Calothrix sp. 336/3]|uniref:TolC family protein n=1 Tax=Calothrix sp. 336/3 TaxID=1337936 RepID=UPI0004E2AD10|nr:TolC family protein [Calothrix sp. 336/3]AKG23084.1 transporter [Calothrix sp. 336/3]
MKGQYIFHSFLPGVTVAVLTSQPAWADTVNVNGVQQTVSPSVTNLADRDLITKLKSTQRQSPPGISQPAPSVGDDNEPVVETKNVDSSSNLGSRLLQGREINYQATPAPGVTPVIKAKTQLPGALPTAVRGDNGAKLLNVNNCQGNCPSQEDSPEVKLTQESSQPVMVNTRKQKVPVPNHLNPNANPLQYPTKGEEVKIQGVQPLTLEQALELAKGNNRELQVSILTLKRTQAALREAQAALLPSVDVSTEISRQQSASTQLSNERTQKQQEDAGIPPESRSKPEDGINDSFNAQAQLTYNLYTSGARTARIKAAEEQVRSQELDVERLSEEIRLNVTTEYYDLQQADENVRIAQSAVKNAEASLKDAQALERAGVGTKFDVLRSQVNLANSQQELTSSLSQQQVNRRRLASRLSLPQSVNLTAADPVKLSGLWNRTLEDSIVLAYQNRPELQQQLAQRNISKHRRKQALAELGPQVSFIANYNLLDQYNDDIGVTDGYTLALRANWNLFDGGAARARASQEKTNMAIAEVQFADTRNQVRFQVEQSYYNLQSNLENVQTSTTALEQAREALRLARLRFQAGVGTQTDVIAAENDLTRAEGSRIRAILDYNRALANLQRSVTTRAIK